MPPPQRVKTEKGLPVVLGWPMSLIVLIYSVYGLLHKGIIWPLKYPAPGELAWPGATVLMIGAICMFINGTYFLFILPPGAGPEAPRKIFRALNWFGIFCLLGAGFVPDNAMAFLSHAAAK